MSARKKSAHQERLKRFRETDMAKDCGLFLRILSSEQRILNSLRQSTSHSTEERNPESLMDAQEL
jgi:hypothetical protein